MANPVNPPRGMRDFLPAEKARRERVLQVIRNTYRAHGFDEIETPVVEDSERLHAGLGGDNEKLAFGILKRGLDAEDLATATDPLELADLGLRYDLTVPLARFYASNRGSLPTVFRSIQIGSVWRAERPQKGRYRQFVQCDIDILGEPGPIAEVELVIATADALRALGLDGVTIRINDRRLLLSMLSGFGFPEEEHESVLISIDKLDKIGQEGVLTELRARAANHMRTHEGEADWSYRDAVDDFDHFLSRPQTLEYLPFGEAAIRTALPEGVDETAIRELAELGAAVSEAGTGIELVFDPFLVRGMGYYTGAIFEVTHPSVGYSIGGGGRYDGMIGRFLGTDVPATGFSLGFERLVELVDLAETEATDAAALVHDDNVPAAQLVALKTELLQACDRVRLERRPKNIRPLLDQLVASGFSRFAYVTADTRSVADLEFRDLG